MFGVLWSDRALKELALYWTEADSAMRSAINESTSDIDHTLQHSPQNAGESRGRDMVRIYFSPQLAVVFEVHKELETVWILRVILLPKLRTG